eukprot:TRINITY_DN12599_c0_g2_i2.p1 TRINITY_DN12599_c0_g2~~TRINITY_DN12599_c0_g2_i2.p1  ORF type:complete len:244 (+),score=45.18 TRINITY_DN12599_c0_g2_i2:183-914(+)
MLLSSTKSPVFLSLSWLCFACRFVVVLSETSSATASEASVKKSWIEHLSCEVCKLGTWVIDNNVRMGGLQGESLEDFLENVCVTTHDDGQWLTMVDVVTARNNAGDSGLMLERKNKPGVCRRECSLVRQSCKLFLNGKEEGIIAELKKGAALDHLRMFLCHERCANIQGIDLTRWEEEAWEEYDPLKREMYRLEKSMQTEGYTATEKDPKKIATMSQGDQEVLAAKAKRAEERETEQNRRKEL